MTVLDVFAVMIPSVGAGLLVGMDLGRRRLLSYMRRVNAERQISDQAVGADLLRQIERSRGRSSR